nr:hypothetical protein [Kibdelosporangium sp. MJ126-NF4]
MSRANTLGAGASGSTADQVGAATQSDTYTDPGLSRRARYVVFADAPHRPRSATTPTTS